MKKISMKKISICLLFAFVYFFSICRAQNVGIGTTTPEASLHLYKSGAASGAGTRMAFGDDLLAGGLRAYIAEYGWQSNTNSNILELHGHTGINFTRGLTSGSLLNSMQILSTGVLQLNVVNTDNTATNLMVRQADGSLALRQLSSIPANLLVLKEDVVNNRVGIGTAVPNFTLDVVHQNGTPSVGSVDPHNGLNIMHAGANLHNWTMYVSNTSGNLQFYHKGILEVEFSIEGSINILSDERVKRNIQPLASEAMPLLSKLIPRQYEYKQTQSGKTSYGFLAQEAMQVFPELVTNTPSDDDGKSIFSVNYMGFIPFIVKGMQEQQAIIKRQNDKIMLLQKERDDIFSRLERIEKLLTTTNQD